MADARRRELERATGQGDEAAALRLLSELLRTGTELSDARLELVAYLLGPPGLDQVARPLGAVPSHVFRKGREVPLETVQRDGHSPPRARLFCLDGGLDAGRLVVTTRWFGHHSEQWHEDAFREVSQLGVRRLLLDLRQCGGASSGGFGAMVRLGDALQRREGALVLLARQQIRIVIDMLGLQAFVNVVDTEAEGLHRLLDAAPRPAALDGDAWLGRLLRWGVHVPLRGALAVGRRLVEEVEDAGQAARALGAAEAWLAEPSAGLARASASAALAARDRAQELGSGAAPHLWWAYRAAHLAGWGLWPEQVPEPLPLHLSWLRQALLAWALRR
jgi:anti-anti-sigma regulatory factor